MTAFAFCVLAFGSHLNADETPNGADETTKIDERFRKLIPAATAIDRKEFEVIARSPGAPTAKSFSEHSLTAALMLPKIRPCEGKSAEQFRYLNDGSPRPIKIVQEMYRPVGAGNVVLFVPPVTMIHSERITRCEATVEGKTARGSFDFHVPDLYEGSADFVAKKNDERGWQMIEFQMKTIGIHVAREADGKWRRVNGEEKHKTKPD
ncbi:hypothetical protein [Stieleria sedimenti]|uniref:hypothetical protein n=1 Tax=Stieleria sedimenti TaxID=2976331 RepID=UPI00217F2D03|nr:hypothetical protein [Stieleria sedimenti]